ncbi:MAG: substrate-binding domain-containing protein [Propionibacteriaceae bacterium]|nr:substrate-binding domain-containing protein [Propionibacteriaceae bacterium]
MRIKKWVAIAAASLLALGTMAGCGDSGSTGGDGGDATLTIGMANLSLGGDYFEGMDKAVKARGAELGFTVVSSNADGDANKLLTDVENLVAQGVDGIIISGAWLNDFPEALAAASDANIPVVLVDRLTSTKNYTAWIGPENERMGKEVGEYLVSQLPNGGTAVIIRGGPEDNTIGIARTAGVTAAFTAAGITIELATDFGGWNAQDGKTAMENMMAKLPQIDVVFCENDDMCLGAKTAAADAGKTNIIFGGIDGSASALAAIADAASEYKYVATGYNDPNVIGTKGVDVMKQILDGETVAQDQPIDSPLITAANVADFI